jgi:2-phospho-L-lactate guanylyltransferase (CobY/MobA/RfbA family)
VRAGAHDLTDSLAVPGLRHDVDTVADLRRALALGVGRHTERAVDRAFAGGLSDVRSDLDRRPPVWTPSGSHSW